MPPFPPRPNRGGPPRGPNSAIRSRFRINREIRAKEVRLIGPDGEQVGIVPIREAMERAQAAELDLVEVAPEAKPPVCKIEDFAKILYQKKRQMREARKRQKTVELKEVKIRPNCDPHDFGIKMKHAQEFLERSMKVKITMMFRGREIATAKERGDQIQHRVMEVLREFAELESVSRTSVRTSTMILAPSRKSLAIHQARIAQQKRDGKKDKAAAEQHDAAAEEAEDQEDDLEDDDLDLEDDDFEDDEDFEDEGEGEGDDKAAEGADDSPRQE